MPSDHSCLLSSWQFKATLNFSLTILDIRLKTGSLRIEILYRSPVLLPILFASLLHTTILKGPFQVLFSFTEYKLQA